MNERQKRNIAENEAAFRRVNEAATGIRRAVGDKARTLVLICECGAPDCHERLTVHVDRYSQARENPRRFLVVPGHEIPEVEEVVDRLDGAYLIEKPPEVDDIVRD